MVDKTGELRSCMEDVRLTSWRGQVVEDCTSAVCGFICVGAKAEGGGEGHKSC